MPSRSCLFARGSRGQIAPVALFGVLIASAVLVMLFNTGQKVTERSQVANAADAAAYSGAVWTARHLNFMAYTNRAMVANHAAVGHFISYVSWVRYVHDSIEAIDRVTQWVPYVGQYIDAVEQVAEQVRTATEHSASIAVPALDAWNANFRAAQLEAQASLAIESLDELMQRTARAYDERISINDREALAAAPSELLRVIEAQIVAQRAAVPSFIRRYTPANDGGNLSELIASSLRANEDMQRWIEGERGWRETGLAFRLRKQGRTTHAQTDNGADWQATDQLQYGTRRVFGWSGWRRIGSQPSSASAREFASEYAGVPAYYNLAGVPEADRALRIAAFATKPQRDVATADLLGVRTQTVPLSAAAMAVVQFRRPQGTVFAALSNNAREFANLFNPMWEARLVPLLSARE
jgi:hypothetical protein